MIDNFWIFVTQLCSVLVYIGIAFGLYRLLAAQKDATIQAKDATIENLQIRLQQAESKVPDTLVTLLENRLKVLQGELERLKYDKDKSSGEIQSLKEGQKAASKTVVNLLFTIKVFQFLSKPINENYKDFVVDVCGSMEEGAKTILASENLTDLASKQGKTIHEVNHADFLGIPREKIIVGKFSSLHSYIILIDNTVLIDNATLREFTRKHEEILGDLN
jgi:hypothetical protein